MPWPGLRAKSATVMIAVQAQSGFTGHRAPSRYKGVAGFPFDQTRHRKYGIRQHAPPLPARHRFPYWLGVCPAGLFTRIRIKGVISPYSLLSWRKLAARLPITPELDPIALWADAFLFSEISGSIPSAFRVRRSSIAARASHVVAILAARSSSSSENLSGSDRRPHAILMTASCGNRFQTA
jgi:hypothetical protein